MAFYKVTALLDVEITFMHFDSPRGPGVRGTEPIIIEHVGITRHMRTLKHTEPPIERITEIISVMDKATGIRLSPIPLPSAVGELARGGDMLLIERTH